MDRVPRRQRLLRGSSFRAAVPQHGHRRWSGDSGPGSHPARADLCRADRADSGGRWGQVRERGFVAGQRLRLIRS
eukprot:4237250-Pyramimonas_sp.AAC.1